MESGKVTFELNTKYGLYELGSDVAIPVSHIGFDVEASYSFAKITQTLTFKNIQFKQATANFYFPRSLSSSYSDLEVYYGNLKVYGSVKAKEDAVAAFNQAQAESKAAALVTLEGPKVRVDRWDCLRFQLTNLVGGLDVTVKMGIIQSVNRNAERWTVKIPSTVTDLYQRCHLEVDKSLGHLANQYKIQGLLYWFARWPSDLS